MKYVYVLISDSTDFYAEQAFVSMYSLKMHNPSAEIICITDEKTFMSLKDGRERIKEYVDKFITVEIPSKYNKVQRSRYLKTSLTKYIKADFVYLDIDTIVTKPLDELEDFRFDVGAVRDGHIPSRIDHEQFARYLKQTKKIIRYTIDYFNGGLLLVRNTCKANQLFVLWHNLWMEENERYGIDIDQPSLAQANMVCGLVIKELDGKYNCQILSHEWIYFFNDHKIIHYYNSPSEWRIFPLNDQKILKIIRSHGITEIIIEIIKNPIQKYLERSVILSGKEKEIYLSPTSILARKLSRNYPWTNKLARTIYCLFGKHI